MEATAASVSTSPQRRRLPLARLLFAAAAIALLVIGGAYALRFISATAFHKERAFRVLDEIGSQLDNLQRTLANQLRLLPTELVGRQCALEFAGKASLSKSCSDRRDRYQRRLALRGPTVGVASVSKDLFTRACGPTNRYGWALRANEPGVPFTAFSCASEIRIEGEGQLLAVAFQGSMAESLEGFVSQNFFDEVLVALGDGTVIATVTKRAEAGSPTLQLHPAKMRRLGVTNVASLLRQSGATSEKSASIKSVDLPSQPEVLPARIADDSYRVFVRAIQPRYGTYVEQESAQPALRQERLFLVGLKREDL